MSNYSWSVCYPDNPTIDEKGSIRQSDILTTFKAYPWREQMMLLTSLEYDKVNYNPSIRFTNDTNGLWLELTAEGEPDKISFSLWYNRPVIKKVFFGLFGEKEGFDVIDKGPFSFEKSSEMLSLFLNEKSVELEKLFS